MFDNIVDAIHRELHELDEKYADDIQMTAQDLEHIDKMAHTLKSLISYEVMYNGCEDSRSRTRRDTRYGYNRRY